MAKISYDGRRREIEHKGKGQEFRKSTHLSLPKNLDILFLSLLASIFLKRDKYFWENVTGKNGALDTVGRRNMV